jgi:hypothetical protein
MYGDDITYIIEAAKGFSFPQGFIFIPRFFFIYIYKVIFFFFGFQPFYFHLVKTLIGALLLYFYFRLATHYFEKNKALFVSIFLMTSSLFVFTTIWIAEPVTLATLFRILIIYLLLFSKESPSNYFLIALLLPAALFSKEFNLVLFPLLTYYLLTKLQGWKKCVAVIPVALFVSYLIFVPTRHYSTLNLNNLLFFSSVLSKYYTPLLLIFVFAYIVFIIFNKVKTKTFFQYDTETFLCLWFLLLFGMLLFGVNQEERYIMELLPPFLLLAVLALQWLWKTNFFQQHQKLCILLISGIVVYIILINSAGILKIEVGWGSFFRGVAEISEKIDKDYPGSLLVYQSGTGDFSGAFHNFTVMQISSALSMTLLYDAQNHGNYTSILYVEYPASIRIYPTPDMTLFDNEFTIKEGIYKFEVYSLSRDQEEQNATNN